MAVEKKQRGAHEAPSVQKHKKKPLSPKEKKRRILIIVLAVAAALLCVVAALTTLIQKPELPDEDVPGPGQNSIASDVERKQDYYTFLIMGRDTGGGGNTDTILLAAYDISNQELNVMSIPRDTMVNVSWDVKKINSVYNYNGGGEKGIDALYHEVSELVGFIPDYSIVVEWEAVGELVDAIGGVWYDVPYKMDYDDPAQDLHIHVEKGYQQLNGEQAMGVVRWRHNNNGSGYATGDIGRIETQQAFLKALIEQCLQIDKVTKVTEYARIFSEQVTTDLTINNIAWFGQRAIFGGLTAENIHFITMPCETKYVWSRSYKTKLSYVVPSVAELVNVVNESFNPYIDDLTAMELDIMYVNADGTIGCTSGDLQDTKANAVYQSRPAATPDGQSGTADIPDEENLPQMPTEEETQSGSALENGENDETGSGGDVPSEGKPVEPPVEGSTEEPMEEPQDSVEVPSDDAPETMEETNDAAENAA